MRTALIIGVFIAACPMAALVTGLIGAAVFVEIASFVAQHWIACLLVVAILVAAKIMRRSM